MPSEENPVLATLENHQADFASEDFLYDLVHQIADPANQDQPVSLENFFAEIGLSANGADRVRKKLKNILRGMGLKLTEVKTAEDGSPVFPARCKIFEKASKPPKEPARQRGGRRPEFPKGYFQNPENISYDLRSCARAMREDKTPLYFLCSDGKEHRVQTYLRHAVIDVGLERQSADLSALLQMIDRLEDPFAS